MRPRPLEHVIGFWKPDIDAREIDSLAAYADPGGADAPGVAVWRTEAEPQRFRCAYGGMRFSLFAAVHPIPVIPHGAEAIAEILDLSGSHHSYVLWHPGEKRATVPFDPAEAIEAFWRERYVAPSERTVLPGRVLSLYYALKPLLPRFVKGRLRRLMARRAKTTEHFLEWPADTSLDRLQRLLLHVLMLALGREELRFAWFWPDGHPWATVLTHDVETADGLARVTRVAGLERERGVRSSFNMVPRDYDTPDSLVRGLRDDGFEVGVHGYTHDGLLFSDRETFLKRVGTINEHGRRWGASGFRSPATYRNLDWFDDLAFEYDSSVSDTAPFEPQPGGCASVFPYLVGDVVELPITVPQDHTLFSLLGETDASTWLSKLEAIRGANGMACVLTHPDPAPGYIGVPENERLYLRLLDAVTSSDAWVPLPRELAGWWRGRESAGLEGIDGMKGMAFGTAVLDGSGVLKVVPPSGGSR